LSAKNLKKGDILFREGDTSEAMYVIKTGKIAITKPKGTSEIVLAELGPGDMLGEMAFFDNKPRSAGAKAIVDTVVIELPFKSLSAQFKTFPEWLKAVVRTVTNHLRNANIKIKNLEKTTEDEKEFFSPYVVTRLTAIVCFIANRFGEKSPEGILIPPNRLRNYTIQVFQQPTAKMNKLMEMLQSFGYMKIEDLGEGRQKLTMFKLDTLMNFVDFYNEWIFKAEEKRTSIEEREVKALKSLTIYGKKSTVDAKGNVKVNLTQMQTESVAVLGYPFSNDDVNSLTEKKVVPEKMSGDGALFLTYNLQDVENLGIYWELIHAFRKVQRD
jgi:CRP/FNR family cyclic AMP-dependent transcriptional regulator